jgi:hypothetical protein
LPLPAVPQALVCTLTDGESLRRVTPERCRLGQADQRGEALDAKLKALMALKPMTNAQVKKKAKKKK